MAHRLDDETQSVVLTCDRCGAEARFTDSNYRAVWMPYLFAIGAGWVYEADFQLCNRCRIAVVERAWRDRPNLTEEELEKILEKH